MLSRYGRLVMEELTGLVGAGVFHGPCSIFMDVLMVPMI